MTGTVLSSLLVLAGCAGGEDVTAASIQAAKQRWHQARVRDYDLEWTSSGLRQSHYVVAVRDGKVRTVEMVQPNGQRAVVRPPEPRFYGVDGLFLVMADELAQLATDQPFGQPRGTKAVLKFTPDPTLGYPQRYRRDVLGARAPLGIDVVRLTPKSSPVR
ncbi:MAG: DUF6174 domain-containing protein [Isosphaeraceae bacterium]|nr:DUF6174 domain-containing protein [Isosphaeraceae bacterium]